MAKLDYNNLAKEILRYVGGARNIINAQNCMTRLRINVKDEFAVNDEQLKQIEGVLQVLHEKETVQIVLGPGVVKKVTDEFNNLISLVQNDITEYTAKTGVGGSTLSITNDWKSNKDKIKQKQKKFTRLNRAMKHLANIFTPLIPAIIAAGMFAAIASIINQATGNHMTGSDPRPELVAVPAQVFYYIFNAFSVGFTGYLTIVCGYNAAKEFGATPMLGAMLGGICATSSITEIAKLIGLYKDNFHILMAGKGGVIGIIIGCLLLSYVEKFLHKKMPNSLDTVFTPLLAMLIVGLVYVFGIMIVTGFISDGIAYAVGYMTMSEHLIVRMIVGFFAAALFLPLVMTGMHHGLVAIYTVELINNGFVSLYPVLAMAGAGQVGAAIALYIKAKKNKNTTLMKNISGSIIPGICGVGEPLIYSVTLPLGLPFLTAGLGAGFGGAFLMSFKVASTAWGPSGIIAIPLMTYVNRQPNALLGFSLYAIGLLISTIAGFIITYLVFRNKRILPPEKTPRELAFNK